MKRKLPLPLSALKPGRLYPLDALPEEPFLVLTSQGVRLYSGICPHLLGPLRKGKIEGERITCPWHGYCFDLLSGRCLTVPGFDEPKNKDRLPAPLTLTSLPFTVEGDEIFVEIEEEQSTR